MINLLPDNYKKQLRAARANVTIARYTGVIVLAFGFLVLVLFGSYLLLSQTKASADLLISLTAPTLLSLLKHNNRSQHCPQT